MLFRVFSSAALGAIMATTALGQDMPVSDVHVTVEIGAVDSNALDHWPQIGPDLTEAVLAALAPQMGSDGLSVAISLNEMSLGGAPTLAEDGEFNRLGGWIYVRDDPADPPLLSEEIVLQADSFVPGGTPEFYTVPGRPEFYNALVNVFAFRVLEELQDLR